MRYFPKRRDTQVLFNCSFASLHSLYLPKRLYVLHPFSKWRESMKYEYCIHSIIHVSNTISDYDTSISVISHWYTAIANNKRPQLCLPLPQPSSACALWVLQLQSMLQSSVGPGTTKKSSVATTTKRGLPQRARAKRSRNRRTNNKNNAFSHLFHCQKGDNNITLECCKWQVQMQADRYST